MIKIHKSIRTYDGHGDAYQFVEDHLNNTRNELLLTSNVGKAELVQWEWKFVGHPQGIKTYSNFEIVSTWRIYQ